MAPLSGLLIFAKHGGSQTTTHKQVPNVCDSDLTRLSLINAYAIRCGRGIGDIFDLASSDAISAKHHLCYIAGYQLPSLSAGKTKQVLNRGVLVVEQTHCTVTGLYTENKPNFSRKMTHYSRCEFIIVVSSVGTWKIPTVMSK